MSVKLNYINRPVFTDRAQYDRAIQDISSQLAAIPGVKTVYRFGNITTPGISDIDLLVVFQNKVPCNASGFENVKGHDYLFTHGIMALCEDHFYRNQDYTIWSE